MKNQLLYYLLEMTVRMKKMHTSLMGSWMKYLIICKKSKDFRVLSRTSTEQYRGSTKKSLPKIAKELNVNYIVEGSGQKYGNKVRSLGTINCC